MDDCDKKLGTKYIMNTDLQITKITIITTNNKHVRSDSMMNACLGNKRKCACFMDNCDKRFGTEHIKSTEL